MRFSRGATYLRAFVASALEPVWVRAPAEEFQSWVKPAELFPRQQRGGAPTVKVAWRGPTVKVAWRAYCSSGDVCREGIWEIRAHRGGDVARHSDKKPAAAKATCRRVVL